MAATAAARCSVLINASPGAAAACMTSPFLAGEPGVLGVSSRMVISVSCEWARESMLMVRSASVECDGASWCDSEIDEYCESRVEGPLVMGGGLPVANLDGCCKELCSCMMRGSGAGPLTKGIGDVICKLRRGLQLLLPPSPYDVTCK